MDRLIINIRNKYGEFESVCYAPPLFDPVTRHDYGFLSYTEGKQLFIDGKYEEALVKFESAIKATLHYKGYEYIGRCHMALGDPGKAIEPLLAASTLNAQVSAPYLCAEALVEIGELSYAQILLELALSREPRHRKSLKLLKVVNEGIEKQIRKQ